MVGEKRSDPSPFCPDTDLYLCSIHKIQKPEFVWIPHAAKFTKLKSQEIQNFRLQLLVGHNIKFDLMWLLETGFTYNKKFMIPC